MAHAVQDRTGTMNPPDSPSRTATYRYYEGFVEKKGPKDKNLEKRWAILEGDKMYFYQSKVGTRELSTQKPLDTLALDRNTSAIPEQKDRCRMTVKCKHATYKIKASSAEELENIWLKVVAVSSANMPKERDLLPGQKQMFADIVIKEKERKAMPAGGDASTPGGSVSFRRPPLQKANTIFGPGPPTPSRHSAPAVGQWDDGDSTYKFYPDHLKLQLPTPPPWFFHKISRDHAEQILLKNADQGHLLIRVSESHPGEYSLSVRQDIGGIVVKHYRFRWENGTFKLLIDEQQPELLTMYELIMFFIERSGGNLKPIQTRDSKVLKLPDNLYEHRFQQQSNGTARPARTSLPASFNQGFGSPGRGGISQPIQEGVQQDDFSSPASGISRGLSQSMRVQGANGFNSSSSPAPPVPSRPRPITNSFTDASATLPSRSRTVSSPTTLGTRGFPLHGPANDAQLRNQFDKLGIDRQ